ncbi:MAG: hypothetical protein ACOX0U_04545 [Oscillospiraceae bacterium]|jgi:hypothetical protein
MNGHVLPVRNKKKEYWGMTSAQSKALYLLSGCFFAGSLLGCLLSVRASGGEEALLTYLKQYLAAVKAGVTDAPGWLAVFWEVFRYPLACMLLSFVSAGRWMIPVIMAVRGFFLSFAVSAFVRLFGNGGLLVAVGVFLPSALVVLPCMMIWGIRRLCMTDAPPSLKTVLPLCGICAAALFCAVIYECCFAASVLSALAPSVIS